MLLLALLTLPRPVRNSFLLLTLAKLHAAFGIFARALPPHPEFEVLHSLAAGIELADSIAGDCHKMLNVVRADLPFLISSCSFY